MARDESSTVIQLRDHVEEAVMAEERSLTPIPYNLKCDRWPDCKERHDMLVARVKELEEEKREDLAQLWNEVRKLAESVSKVATSVAGLDGRMAGYLAAAGVLAAVVAAIAQKLLR